MRKIYLLFITILISGCAYLGYLHDPFTDIPNFRKVNDSIYSGGTPKPAGIKRLKDLGIKTIVDLNDSARADNMLSDFNVIKIPISIYKKPELDLVKKFLRILTDKTKHPVFITCANGRDQNGAMTAIYRVTVDGLSIKDAYDEAKAHGFWPYRGNDELKNFLHQLKDYPELYELNYQEKS